MRLPEHIKAEIAAGLKDDVEFERPADSSFGDFATNVALKRGSDEKKNPREIAEKIIKKLELPDEIAKAEVAGPGFINFTYSDKYLLDVIQNSGQILNCQSCKGKVIVEYSSPNIAKPLGVHHLMSTIIGQAIYNILKELGYDTVSITHLGDWGTQFGKLIYAYKEWGEAETIEKDPINELLKLYVKFHDEEEKDESITEKGREEFKKLEEKDTENTEIWQWICALSKRDNQKVYDMLGGINFDSDRGEAAYSDDLPDIIDEGLNRGIIKEGKGGSLIVDLEKEDLPPYLVRKGDGATLYSTRDIAAIKYRIEKYHPDKIIYVVDVAQKLHFEQLFKSAKKFPWFKEDTELIHLWFGRMRFSDAKMSTRKGNIIRLEDVLKEAYKRSLKIIEEKNPDISDKKEVAAQVGSGAVKYSILNQSPETDIIFDWDKILSLEGNAAPYLQYTYARAASILKECPKCDVPAEYNFCAEEAAVIRTVIHFKEIVLSAGSNLKPNRVANFLYEVAQKFNQFYVKCPVLKAQTEDAKNTRLAVTDLTAKTIKKGLRLLGNIETPEKM